MQLIVKINGSVANSNFDQYKDEILAVIKNHNKELVTDGDFIEAKEVIKSCSNAEKAISKAKQDAINSTVDINALFSSMDEVMAELRSTRLALNKQVTSEIEARKNNLVADELIVIKDHVDSIDVDYAKEVALNLLTTSSDRLKKSYRGKSSPSSIEIGVKAESLAIMTDINAVMSLAAANDKELSEIAGDFMSIFPDRVSIICRDNDSFRAIAEARIQAHIAEQKSNAMRQAEKQRKADEFKALKDKNDTEKAVQTVDQNIVSPTILKPVSPEFEIKILMSGDIVKAQEAARMIKALFDDDSSVSSVVLTKIKEAG